ncbi:MAG: folate-binding protein [Proteobacteria bacterium]|nr:folate-binding protein [Pseudomonadota bacterium]
MITLDNRAVIYISGADRKSFLQGLVTNDINKVSSQNALYAIMLNPQGRFLYDFFIIEQEDRLLLDCNQERIEEIVKKLSLYKLRAAVEIGRLDAEYSVGVTLDEKEIHDLEKQKNSDFIAFIDPRNKQLGLRIIAKKELLPSVDPTLIKLYHQKRFELKLVDDSDLEFNQSLILEYGFDNFNAIDYQKGCYIGQEVTARTHYRGLVRKEIFLIEIPNLQQVTKGTEITCDNKKTGIVLSSIFHRDKLQALALIKSIDAQNQKIDLANLALKIGENDISIIK